MSHEIDLSNNRENMAYVGAVPWHGLGQRVDPNADIDTWAVAGGLNWEAITQPVTFNHNGETRVWGERRTLFRSDTGKPLAVVSDRYQPVQPREVLEFFRKLVDASSHTIETVGSLRGGRKVWALAKARESVVLPGNDVVNQYVLLATSYDFSLPTIAMPTSVRVVCQNTLNMAAGWKGKNAAVRVLHVSKFDAEAARNALGFTEAWLAFAGLLPQLAAAKMSEDDAHNFTLAAFDLEPSTKAEMDSAGKLLDAVRISRTISSGADLPSARGTVWGAVNGITHYLDYLKPAREAGNRINSAWFGKGAEVKARALKLAAEYVGAEV